MAIYSRIPTGSSTYDSIDFSVEIEAGDIWDTDALYWNLYLFPVSLNGVDEPYPHPTWLANGIKTDANFSTSTGVYNFTMDNFSVDTQILGVSAISFDGVNLEWAFDPEWGTPLGGMTYDPPVFWIEQPPPAPTVGGLTLFSTQHQTDFISNAQMGATSAFWGLSVIIASVIGILVAIALASWFIGQWEKTWKDIDKKTDKAHDDFLKLTKK